MKKIKRTLYVLLIFMITLNTFGCSDSSSEETITISGSSAMLPLIEISLEEFLEENPQYIINAQAGGSGTGITQVYDNTAQIGMSDVYAEDKISEDKAKELFDNKIAVQGFCIVVNKSLPIKDISKENIQKIFKGDIKNWNEIGGPDEEIFVIHRPASSGTRAAFIDCILDGDGSLEKDSIGAIQDSNGAVLKTLKQNKGGISYLSLSYLNLQEAKENVNVVSINKAEPTRENIINGTYEFWSYCHLYTRGKPEGLSAKFINYIVRDNNKDKIYEVGFIPINDIHIKSKVSD